MIMFTCFEFQIRILFIAKTFTLCGHSTLYNNIIKLVNTRNEIKFNFVFRKYS